MSAAFRIIIITFSQLNINLVIRIMVSGALVFSMFGVYRLASCLGEIDFHSKFKKKKQKERETKVYTPLFIYKRVKDLSYAKMNMIFTDWMWLVLSVSVADSLRNINVFGGVHVHSPFTWDYFSYLFNFQIKYHVLFGYLHLSIRIMC